MAASAIFLGLGLICCLFWLGWLVFWVFVFPPPIPPPLSTPAGAERGAGFDPALNEDLPWRVWGSCLTSTFARHCERSAAIHVLVIASVAWQSMSPGLPRFARNDGQRFARIDGVAVVTIYEILNRTGSLKSRQIKAIQIHHLAPSHHKVVHEGLLRVAAGIDLGQGSELRVGA